MNRRFLRNSVADQSFGLAGVVARVRSQISLLRQPENTQPPERSVKARSNRNVSPLAPASAARGTEGQRRYWKGGKRQPAKVVLPAELASVLQYAESRRYADRDRVMVLLSFKAGLRACEIAGLRWKMVLGSDAAVSVQIVLSQGITKGGRGRTIPMHCQLQDALRLLHQSQGLPLTGHVIRSERQNRFNTQSVVNWFASAYHHLGLVGCSSHSGRRTFITASARVLAKTGGSLRDIQELAGHRALTTTERYIEGDRAAQRRLIELL